MELPNKTVPTRIRPKAEVRLDENESPFNAPYNRYLDESSLSSLKQSWGKHEHIPSKCIYFCNSTEESTDLIMRAFTRQHTDNVVAITPTRSIYKKRSLINNVSYKEAPLRESDYELDASQMLNEVDNDTKLIFLCSPNSPTGNLLDTNEIELILQLFDGIVVVDESYIDFCAHASVVPLLNKYKNLIILRSFSHAWSMAGVHMAAIVAYPDVIDQISKVGFTHPISCTVEEMVSNMLSHRLDVDKWTRQIIDERTKVRLALSDIPACKHIYHSDANFLLVRFDDCQSVYKYLLKNGIAVKPVCGCLRISIGLPTENSALLGALRRRKIQKNV